MSDQEIKYEPLDGAVTPRFGGMLTFMRLVKAFKRVLVNKHGLFRFGGNDAMNGCDKNYSKSNRQTEI